MGIFDGIIGSVVSGIGGVVQNAMNADQAQKNRDFQEQMSSTAYQRGMADMKSAGLNPILAYQKGPASSPTGNMAVATNVGEQAVAGYNTARRVEADVPKTNQETALAKVQTDNAISTNDLIRQQTAESAARTSQAVADTGLKTAQANYTREQIPGATEHSKSAAYGNSAKSADSTYYDSTFGKGVRFLGNTLSEINPLKGFVSIGK